MVPDRAVVSDVAIDHEIIVTADDGLPCLGRAPMNGDAFAKNVAIADFQTSRLALVPEVLRPLSQNGAGEDLVLTAHN